jgi:hypothetical protein
MEEEEGKKEGTVREERGDSPPLTICKSRAGCGKEGRGEKKREERGDSPPLTICKSRASCGKEGRGEKKREEEGTVPLSRPAKAAQVLRMTRGDSPPLKI